MIRFIEKPQTEQLIEIAAVGDDSFARSLGYYSGPIQLNPDPILQSQAGNRGIDLFTEMEDKDPNIFSDLQTRKLAVVGLDWEIIPASEDPRDAAAAEFNGEVLGGLRGFAGVLYGLLDAVGKGYAVSEALWAARADGRIGIAAIKSRHQRRFLFDLDAGLRLLSDADSTQGTPVPPRKFLVHTFQGAHENPYGRGVLSRIYWYYWFKKNALKFWALYQEKFGSPTPVGKYPPGTDAEPRNRLLATLNALQQETGVIIPNTMTIEFLEAQQRGRLSSYDNFLDYLDRQCTKAILGQTLTTGEGARTGSLALGRVHAEVRQDILEADAASLAEVLNGQLIHWLTDWNFQVTAYPIFVFKVDPPEDLTSAVTRDRQLQAMGVPIPKSYVQRRYGIPDPEGDDDILEPRTDIVNTKIPGAAFAEGDLDRILRDTDGLLMAAAA